MKNAPLLIGKIIGPHGIRGNLKVMTYSESHNLFARNRKLLRRQAGGSENHLTVLWAKPHQRGILMAVREITDREGAEAAVGAELYINRNDLPETEAGTYYWADLMTVAVYTVNGDFLGRIEEIFPTGSNDVYVTRNGDRETLIPALQSVIVDVDLEARMMTVDLPEGL